MKKEYIVPKLVVLGSASGDTKSQEAANSDVLPFQDNTAIPPSQS